MRCSNTEKKITFVVCLKERFWIPLNWGFKRPNNQINRKANESNLLFWTKKNNQNTIYTVGKNWFEKCYFIFLKLSQDKMVIFTSTNLHLQNRSDPAGAEQKFVTSKRKVALHLRCRILFQPKWNKTFKTLVFRTALQLIRHCYVYVCGRWNQCVIAAGIELQIFVYV